ncbi:MAG: polysaccharide deacetylase family protein [Clostridia bacterium]|nr:polysaccharide deacetylase family protein [Clostridia bacterium]
MKMFLRRCTILLICISIIPTCISGCSNGKSDDVAQELNFQHAAQDREVGITQSMITYEDNYAYGIHYPTIGIAEIDNIIKSTVRGFADEFISTIGDYKAHKDDELAILTADYKTYLISDGSDHKYVSLVFEKKTSVPKNNIHTENIHTMFFDLNEKKDLQFSDIFKPKAEIEISKQVVNYFKNNRLYSSMTGSDKFKQNTSEDIENFQSFSFNGDKVIFYFDAGTLFGIEEGCVEAALQVKNLKDIISKDIFNAVFQTEDMPEKEETETQPSESTENNYPASIPSGSKYIAFTFDDGPHREITPRILDTLEKTNSHATFFVLGTRVGSYADIIKRANSLGCEIGNHSYSHAKLRNLSIAKRKSEINQTNKLIKEITGRTPTLFRVPYGDFKGIENDIGMPLVQWSIDTKDWKYSNCTGTQRERAKQKIVASVLDNVNGGEIVLMHDLYDLTAETFEEISEELIKRGFVLVTVSELYEIYGIDLEPGIVYRTPKRDQTTNKTPQ